MKILENRNFSEWVLAPLAWLPLLIFYFSGSFDESPKAPILNDTKVLHAMALNYLESGVMSYTENIPTLTQLPLVPWFLAQVYRLFGEDPRNMIYFQIFLAGISIPLTVKLLNPILGKWRWAFGLLWIFDLHQITYPSIIITEFWIVQLWFPAWVFLYLGIQKDLTRYWVFSALCLGMAANIKPLSVYLPFFLIPFLFALAKSGYLQRIKKIALFLAVYLLCFIPLLTRNWHHTGEFPRYTTITSFNMWYHNLPYYKALESQISVPEARHYFVEVMRQRLNAEGANIPPIDLKTASGRHSHREALGLNEFEYAKHSDVLSKEYLKDHFWGYVGWHLRHAPNIFTISNLSWIKLTRHHFQAFSMGWNPMGWIEIAKRGGNELFFVFCRFWELGYSLLFLGLGTLGFFRLRKLFDLRFFFFSWTFPLYVTLVCGVNVWGRFRYLFMPMLICLGLVVLRSFIASRKMQSESLKDSAYPSNVTP